MVSQALTDDWDEADCLCQGKVPEDKRIDFLQRKFDEKKQVWKWKSQLRYHKDCPIHGIKVPDAART